MRRLSPWIAVAVLGLWGCGSSPGTTPMDAGADGSTSGLTLSAPGIDLGGHLVVLHWSELGGSTGEAVAIGTWPEGSQTFPLSLDGLAPPQTQRFDLSDVGQSGTISFAWLMVVDEVGADDLETAAVIASAPNAMLVELGEDAAAGSWVARLVNGPVSAGVHVLDIREYTEEEIDTLTTCMENAAGDPDLECPALKEHVSVGDAGGGRVIQLAAGDVVADLS